ncbi:MAG: hypothetical protein KAJ72_03375 [Candidatus Heimdallarchaeota archaeon]|nr:hypothetical protein [Candidatus Heimdallarchaeota archaeon]
MSNMLIRRILIVTDSGLPVFDYEEYSRGDEVLVSGLVTAILRFAEETEKERLSRVYFEESLYILTVIESVILIFQISDEMPGEYAEYVSNQITESFIKNYREEVKNFRGDVSVFQDFQKTCKKILLQNGIEIANCLINTPEGEKLKAWCLYSLENEPLLVKINTPNYNIDSFTIFQVLGKSFRKVSEYIERCSKGSCFHITHEGNLVQAILLPSVFIVIETAIDEMAVQRFRQFKVKSQQQLKDIINDFYKPDKIQIYSKKEFLGTPELDINSRHKNLYDLFNAAEKGLEYLYKIPIHVQILNFQKRVTVIIKLVNRVVFLEFDSKQTSVSIIESTKRMFEQEELIKDDTPEVMLEKS